MRELNTIELEMVTGGSDSRSGEGEEPENDGQGEASDPQGDATQRDVGSIGISL